MLNSCKYLFDLQSFLNIPFQLVCRYISVTKRNTIDKFVKLHLHILQKIKNS